MSASAIVASAAMPASPVTTCVIVTKITTGGIPESD